MKEFKVDEIERAVPNDLWMGDASLELIVGAECETRNGMSFCDHDSNRTLPYAM
jgi:hypothetical protein